MTWKEIIAKMEQKYGLNIEKYMTWKEIIANMEQKYGLNINSNEIFSLFEIETYIEGIYEEKNNE